MRRSPRFRDDGRGGPPPTLFQVRRTISVVVSVVLIPGRHIRLPDPREFCLVSGKDDFLSLDWQCLAPEARNRARGTSRRQSGPSYFLRSVSPSDTVRPPPGDWWWEVSEVGVRGTSVGVGVDGGQAGMVYTRSSKTHSGLTYF